MSKHKEAAADYRAGMTYKQIAAKWGVSLSTVKSWKTRYPEEWTRTKPKRKVRRRKGAGAPLGNKNAIGSRGGYGGPPGNQKALKTGEHQTIFYGCLTPDEQSIYSAIETSHEKAIDDEIRLLTIRERRMLQRIQDILAGLTEAERRVLQERQVVSQETIQVHSDITGKSESIRLPVFGLVTSKVEERLRRKIDDILRIEEALTRVQDKKIRLLALKHKANHETAMLELKRRELEMKDW